MKYDKEKFENEFNRLMNKGTISYNHETGEWSRKGDSFIFGEEGSDIIINSNDHKYEYLKDYEPSEAEEEIADELTVAWEDFKKKLFTCLDIFLEDTEYKFFEAFGAVCLSLIELWKITSYDKEIQHSIFRFLDEIDNKRVEKIEKELWFCMFTKTREFEAKADILTDLIISELSWNFPYPGYYEDEAFNFFNGLGELSVEARYRLERDYEFLWDIYFDIKKRRGVED